MKKLLLTLAATLILAPCLLAQSTTLTLPAKDSTSSFKVEDTTNLVLMRLNGDAGFYLGGTYGTGTIPASGAGTRLIWYPAKAAFRAGSVDGTQWDNTNVGNYSVAMGSNTKATGKSSVALGENTTASNDYSVAMGDGTTASAAYSFAMGYGSTASNPISVAMGYQCHSNGQGAVALGYNATANGSVSEALGYNVTANGLASEALGYNTKASAQYSTAMGNNSTAQAYNSLAIGRYNVVEGDSTSWVSTDPLFVVGNGTSSSDLSNALTLYKNGNLTIAGQIKIAGGSPGAGKVLTSDSAGLASWVTAGGIGLNDAYNNGATITADSGAVTIAGTDGFISTGTYGTGTIPASGGGIRLMWYPAKAAFRAGEVDSTQWDNTNIGNYSAAMGSNPKATGTCSVALGGGTTASGGYSFAAGVNSIASGHASVAMGSKTKAGGEGSFAVGISNTASGDYSVAMGNGTAANGLFSIAMGQDDTVNGTAIGCIAMGYECTVKGTITAIAMGMQTKATEESAVALGENTTASAYGSFADGVYTTASGAYSFAAGDRTKASGQASTAMGDGSKASGQASTAMGYYSEALGDYSFAAGRSATANGKYSTAIGPNTTAQAYSSMAIGRFDTTYGTTDSWVSTDPLFVVGNGTSSSDKSNALTLYKNGNLTIAGQIKIAGGSPGAGKVLTSDSAGLATWTAAGGISLNDAYNNGATITANSGPVTISGKDGIISTGDEGSGASLSVSGAGTRMIWYPRKAAFRAGEVSGTDWDDANIGTYSVAMGEDALASGYGSFAMGNGITVTGDNSVAMGIEAFATGYSSVALGNGVQAHGDQAVALGWRTSADGDNSTALGPWDEATGTASATMGWQTTAQAYSSLVIGRYNVIEGTKDSWVSTDPLFVCGNGSSYSNASNALTLYKNGNLTIAGQIKIAGGSPGAGKVLTSDSTGLASWVTAGGIGLNDAYNNGATITADSGAVTIAGTDGFISTGTYGTGAGPSVSGPGTRMIWYPAKAAFRAGYVNGDQWDDDSIGNHSVAMGGNTSAKGNYSTALGYTSSADGDVSVAIGGRVQAGGVHAAAFGYSTTASGDNSTAMGSYVSTNSEAGSFVLGDFSTSTITNSTTSNQMMMRFAGGYILYTSSDLSSGAELLSGSNSWSTISDSTKKYAFLPVNDESVLKKINKFNMRTWSYKGQDSTKFRHYGPMAQEFFNAFGHDKYGVAGNDTTINQADLMGVNMTAIQGLIRRTNRLKSENEKMKNEIAGLKKSVEQMKTLLAEITKNKTLKGAFKK